MAFNLELLPKIHIEQVTTDTGRFYRTPDGDFPSVTTVIGRYFGDTALRKWRERIGYTAAEAISYQARTQGTRIHGLLENYILGNETVRQNPLDMHLFQNARKFLDKNLSTVYGVEHQLYSKELKCAGTSDVIGVWQNKYKGIGDFKTAKKVHPVNEERLHKYRIQSSCYAMMVEERYGIKIPYNLIIFLSPEENHAIPDISSVDKYREEVREIFGVESSFYK